MKKVLVLVLVLLLLVVISSGMVSCAAPTPASSELRPCEVELAGVFPVFQGAESVTYLVTFTVLNPNAFEITLDNVGYSLSTEGVTLAIRQFPDDIYIPAEAEANITAPFTVVLFDLIGAKMMGEGFSQDMAVGTVLPLWKLLDGKLPPFESSAAAALLPAVAAGMMPAEAALKTFEGTKAGMSGLWAKIPDKDLIFMAEVTVSMSGAGQSAVQDFELSWTEQ